MPKESKYKYDQADTYFMINTDDRDLIPVKIPIPRAPLPHNIEGYGLPPKDQRFERAKIPHELERLENEFSDMGELGDYLVEHQTEYRDELEFIAREWERRNNGHWFYNNGKPTYIDGIHYLYISYWGLDTFSGHADYRDRDRKWFCTVRHFMKDPLCLGVCYPKHRREGATHRSQCWIYEIISKSPRSHGGIQSATEGHASDVFQLHLIPGWKALPFFFKPIFEGSTNPKSVLSFNEPGVMVKKGAVMSRRQKALQSRIDFKSSSEKAYDSRKLKAYHSDEPGKTTEIDITKRHDVVKECMVDGKDIIGFALYTSTVEEQNAGGANFKRLCDASHYEHWDEKKQRDKNGRTRSGLYNVFMPACEGYKGFIDEYGNSDTEAAREYLINKRQAFIDSGEFEDFAKEVRKYPLAWAECFRGDASQCKFNTKILHERLDILTIGVNKHLVLGDFEWKNGVVDSEVIFVPKEKGKWRISWLFENQNDSNRYYIRNEVRYPANENKFVVGCDPFKFKTTRGGNKSDGGGAIKRLRDVSIDPDEKDINEWDTEIMIGSYLHRTSTKEEYAEDMLMAAIYYGCLVSTEINVPVVWEYIDNRSYPGYLFYDTDKKTGVYKKTPGFNTTASIIEEIFLEWQKYIEMHGHRDVHDIMLQQCLEIRDDMGDFDAFTAGGMAHLAAKRLTTTFIKQQDKDEQVEEFLRSYDYN